MKTAVLICGQIRDAKRCFESINEHVVQPYNADVFIDTWMPSNDDVMLDHRGDIIRNDMSIDEIISNYRPKLITVEDFNNPLTSRIKQNCPKSAKSYDGNLAWETKVENVFYMYYKLWRVSELKTYYENMNGFKYDCVIRLRFDLQFESFPIFNPESNQVFIPERGDHRGGINDLLAVGGGTAMDKYTSLFKNMKSYIENGVGLHPESLLRSHLEISNVQVDRFPLTYNLRGISL